MPDLNPSDFTVLSPGSLNPEDFTVVSAPAPAPSPSDFTVIAEPKAPSVGRRIVNTAEKAGYAFNQGISSGAEGIGRAAAELSDPGALSNTYRQSLKVRQLAENNPQWGDNAIPMAMDVLRTNQDIKRTTARGPGEALEGGAKEVTAEWKALRDATPGNETVAKGAEFVGGAIPPIAESMIPVVGPELAALQGAASTGGQTYDAAYAAYKEHGLSDEEAHDKAMQVATASGLGSGLLFSRLPGAAKPVAELMQGEVVKALPATAKAALHAGLVMAANTGQEGLNAKASYNPDLSPEDIAKDMLKSFGAGVLIGGVAHGASEVARSQEPKPPGPGDARYVAPPAESQDQLQRRQRIDAELMTDRIMGAGRMRRVSNYAPAAPPAPVESAPPPAAPVKEAAPAPAPKPPAGPMNPFMANHAELVKASEEAAAAHPSTYDVGEEPTAVAPAKQVSVIPAAGATDVPQVEVTKSDTRVIDPATGHPVQDTDVDPRTLKLSPDVPNLKSGAGDTGEVAGAELTGKYTRIGTGRTVVWERTDGSREVITGRHRWQLALRQGVKDFPVQILREADGFTKEMALVLDAESNMRDNQGTVQDYAHYFRNTPYDEKTAIERGLLRAGPDAKGRDGFNIGRYASDGVYTAFMGGTISAREASAIARFAPGDENLQRYGLKVAENGASLPQIVARMESMRAQAQIREEQGGKKWRQQTIFGDDAEWIRMEETAERQGDYVAAERKRLKDQIDIRKSILSKPEAATGTGSIKAKAKQARAEMEQFSKELEAWNNWPLNPELKAQVEKATGTGPTPVEKAPEPVVEAPKPKADTGTGDMFGESVPVATKTPEQLAAEKEAKDKADALAAGAGKKLTGSVDTTMTLPGTEAAAGAGDIPLLTQPMPQAEPTAKPEGFFESAMTAEEKAELAALEAQLRNKLGQTNMNVDPEYFTLGARIATLYVKAGARKFRDFANAMLQKFGDKARPYLLSWYNHVRTSGIPTEGMDSEPTSEAIYEREYATNRDNGNGRQPAVPVANGGGGGKRTPIPRVVRKELIPEPRSYVGTDSYGASSLDTDQVLGVNSALTYFSKVPDGGAFLLGDGTGFGKTRQILGIIDQYRKAQPGARVLYVTQNRQLLEYPSSWIRDAQAMGIDLSRVDTGTYDSLKKEGINHDYDLAVFDEAHNLKNAESGKSMAAARIQAKHKVFATATPMDRPTGAAYFLAEITGEDELKVAEKLGYKYVERQNQFTKEPYKAAVLLPDTTWKKVWANIMAFRDASIATGAMLRREYPFYGEVKEHQVGWEQPAQSAAVALEKFYDNWAASINNPMARAKVLGQKTLASRRWSETTKVPATYDLIKEWIAKGGQVIVMAETDKDQSFRVRVPGGVEGLNDQGKPIWKVPGSLSQLSALLERDGIEVAHIHDTKSNTIATEVDKFQKGKAPVALATPKSGGAGINLDDTVGDKPRLLIAMSPELAGDIFDQVLGRVSRKTTQSEATALLLNNGAAWADSRSKEIRDIKIRTLRAIQGGEDADSAAFAPAPADTKASEPAPVVAGVPDLPWRTFITKKGKTRYTAEVTPEFTAWAQNNPQAMKALGISLSEWKGRTSAWADQVPNAKGQLPNRPHDYLYQMRFGEDTPPDIFVRLMAERDDLIGQLQVPEGWRVKDIQTSRWHSVYWIVEGPDGELLKLRIADHPPTKTVHGPNDFVGVVQKDYTLGDFKNQMRRAENFLRGKAGMEGQPDWNATEPGLATEPPGELFSGKLDQVAQGPEAIKALIADPETQLPQRTRDLALAMLDTPVMRNLDWSGLTMALRGRIEGGYAGLAHPLSDLVEISRAANADTFPHEVFHLLYELLPESDKGVVDQLRREAIAKTLERTDLTPEERTYMESLRDGQPVGSEYFKRDMLKSELYPMINPSEFLSSMAGEKFNTDQWGSRNDSFLKSFVGRVKDWVRGIIDSVKRVVGIRPDLEQIYRELLAGKHQNRVNMTLDEALATRGSFSRTAEEAKNAERLARTKEEREVEASHQLVQSSDIMDFLERHGAGTADRRAQKLLSYFDFAGIREAGRKLNGGVIEGYRQLKGKIADPFQRAWMARITNSKYEGFTRQLDTVIKERDAEQQKMASPAFVHKMMKEQVMEADKDAAAVALRNTTAIFAAAHAKAVKALEYERAHDRESAQLEGQLQQIEEAQRSSTAMQQLIADMVAKLSSTAQGQQMLTDPNIGNRTEMLKLYRQLKSAAGETLHHDTLLRWGAFILDQNKEVRDAILAQQLSAQAPIRAQMNAYEAKFMAELEKNPVKAIAKVLRERTKLTTDQERAAFAWREIHREVMERLTKFESMNEAATVAENIKADPDFKALRNEIAKDGRMIGGGEAAKAFSDTTILLPNGGEFDVTPKDLVGSKTRFDQNRARYEAARDILKQWLDNPVNIDDPNYDLHRRNYEKIVAYYTGLSMELPSDPMRAFKRTFDIVKNAVEVAGGRLAPGARKALSQLDSDHHAASAWTQRWSNSLAIATQKAIQSHDIDYSTFGGTSIHDANALYYENIGNQLRYSFNRQAGAMQVGDTSGSGWKVTRADLGLVAMEAQAVSEGFKLLGDRQMTTDTLGGHTLIRKAIKGNENMTVRTYTQDKAMLQFARDFDAARKAKDEKAMLKLLDTNWDRLGYALTWDRNPDFAKATMFDGAGAPFEVLAGQMARSPGQIGDTTQFFDALSSLSSATPDEAKAVVLNEWGRIIHDWAHEMEDTGIVTTSTPRADETKNTFTRSRNEAVAPYVLYENGFKTTSDVERFGLGITSRAFDDVTDALKAQEQDVKRQQAEFAARVVEEMNRSKKTLKEARYAVQHAAAMERANGRNFDQYQNLEWRMKVLSDVRKLMDSTTKSLSDDATVARYIGNMTSMLIGTAATARNVTLSPIYLGHMALRLGVAWPKAMFLSAWKGYVTPGLRMLPSLALTMGKMPFKGLEGAWDALSKKEQREAQGWIGTILHPMVEELSETVYNRVKAIREMQADGVLHMHEATKQWDNMLMGTWMTRGRILEKDYSTAQKIATLPVALLEAGVGTFHNALMPQFGDTWLNMGVNMMMRSSAGPFQMWETSLRRMYANYVKSHYRVFDFTNPQSSVNRISHQEFFPRSITELRATSNPMDMVRLRQSFLDAGIDFDEAAMRFLKELSTGNTKAQFLNDAERDRFVSSGIDFANRSGLSNNSLRLRLNDWMTTLARPFMQWKVRMLSNFVGELAIPGQTSSPVSTRGQMWRSRAFQYATMATTMMLPILIWNALVGVADEEENRVIKKAMFNQVTGFRQPWERDNPWTGYGIYAVSSVPFLDMIASTMLSEQPNRASFDPSLAMVEKAKDVTKYIGGAMQTGDWTYRLPELIGGLFPDAKIVLNRLESQQGKRELNNVVALARRHGETDLIRPPDNSAGIQATRLTPYADKMVAAAMNGDTAKVKEIYDEAVQVATEMGKAHPEQAVKAMFEGRNPYTRVFRAQLSPEQRQEFLSKLSPQERATVESVENLFAAGGEAIGAATRFEKAPPTGGGASGGSRYGALASYRGSSSTASAGATIPGGVSVAGGGSLRPRRLSGVGSPTVLGGVRAAGIRRRGARLSGIRASRSGSGLRRLRGPRLSGF